MPALASHSDWVVNSDPLPDPEPWTNTIAGCLPGVVGDLIVAVSVSFRAATLTCSVLIGVVVATGRVSDAGWAGRFLNSGEAARGGGSNAGGDSM
ncbi:hypothetical protein Pmi06nite_07000 [Planotetraspora mira]|uniref:Uncharacterized protein n=1 Tax=Planotetraspora mira TaxID=58121 RepID=A0A8J3X891_9ACTN|nr:hypothetical protein Pmi06nite_07000 [Planotetraspora mira]